MGGGIGIGIGELIICAGMLLGASVPVVAVAVFLVLRRRKPPGQPQ